MIADDDRLREWGEDGDMRITRTNWPDFLRKNPGFLPSLRQWFIEEKQVTPELADKLMSVIEQGPDL